MNGKENNIGHGYCVAPKYRAWSVKDKKMYDISGFASGEGLIASIDTIDHGRKYPGEYGDGLFYLISSALFNDKNGNLIYQGDLLKYKGNKLVREVDMIKGCWSIIHGTTIYKLFEYGLEYEIIGNIYQNKDLIGTVG